MAKHIYDKRIVLYKMSDEDSEIYEPVPDAPVLHAHVNTANFTEEKYDGRAMQYDTKLNFYFRYSKLLHDAVLHPQLYRLEYNGDMYDVAGGDDFQMKHSEIALRAVIANGGR